MYSRERVDERVTRARKDVSRRLFDFAFAAYMYICIYICERGSTWKAFDGLAITILVYP